MSECRHCQAFETAERAALTDAHMPVHSLDPSDCTCSPRTVTVTFLTADAFRSSPQQGHVIEQEVDSFFRFLSNPALTVITDPNVAKKVAGAWCPCALEGGIVKGGTGPFDVLPLDVDRCGPDGFDRSCEAFGEYRGVIVTTCSAEPADVRHRVVLLLSRRTTAAEHGVVWKHVQRACSAGGITIDPACKNANRLYYAPVRRVGALFRVQNLEGVPIDVDRLLQTVRAEEERARQRLPARVSAERNDKPNIERAIRSAAEAVARAPEGARNETLVREAFSLARFHTLPESRIFDALTSAATVAGLSAREAEKTVANGIQGRKRGAA